MSRAVALLASSLLLVGGCSKAKSEATTPAAAQPTEAAAAAPEAPPKSGCPATTQPRGSAPPEGRRTWCELADGREHGPMKSWHHGEQLKTTGGYFEGRPHGPWQSWDESGALRSQGEYDRGQMVGTWTTFYASGQKATEICYQGNTADYEAWHPNGTRHRQGQYQGGQETGQWKEWDAEGNLLSTSEGDAVTNADAIGVPECDRYIEVYSRCMREKMPPSIRDEVQKAIDESSKTWRREAKTPESRAQLAELCRVAHATMLRSMESLGCR